MKINKYNTITIFQFKLFIDMIEDNAIPLPKDYEIMTIEELKSMGYTYKFGLTNKK